jgi:hypothetical protein
LRRYFIMTGSEEPAGVDSAGKPRRPGQVPDGGTLRLRVLPVVKRVGTEQTGEVFPSESTIHPCVAGVPGALVPII